MKRTCPVCGNYGELVDRDHGEDWIAEFYVGNSDCKHEFTIEFGNPIVTVVYDHEGNEIPEVEWYD